MINLDFYFVDQWKKKSFLFLFPAFQIAYLNRRRSLQKEIDLFLNILRVEWVFVHIHFLRFSFCSSTHRTCCANAQWFNDCHMRITSLISWQLDKINIKWNPNFFLVYDETWWKLVDFNNLDQFTQFISRSIDISISEVLVIY